MTNRLIRHRQKDQQKLIHIKQNCVRPSLSISPPPLSPSSPFKSSSYSTDCLVHFDIGCYRVSRQKSEACSGSAFLTCDRCCVFPMVVTNTRVKRHLSWCRWPTNRREESSGKYDLA